MKRFLVEIGIAVVLIAIGTSFCFFELTDYDVIVQDDLMDQKTVSVNIDEHHPLRLKLDDDLIVQYEYDETLNNEVKIEYNSLLHFQQNDHTIKIKDSSLSFHNWVEYCQVFFDGLRDHKIVAFHHDEYDEEDFELITITCSKAAKRWIEIH